MKKQALSLAVGAALAMGTAPLYAEQILFPYFESGPGKYTFLSFKGDGFGRNQAFGNIAPGANAIQTLSYVFNYRDPDSGDECIHFDVQGAWTDFDLIQQTVIHPDFIFDGTNVSEDFGDASTPAYLPIAGDTRGFLTVLDQSGEGRLTGQAILVNPAVGLVTAYRAQNNPFSTPVNPNALAPNPANTFDATFNNAGNFGALGFTSHLSHDLTWYPTNIVDTTWYVLVTGTDMDNRNGWNGAVNFVNGFGGVFDRDENFLSGTRNVLVECYDFVTPQQLMNAAQLNGTRTGGWGWFASVPVVDGDGDPTTLATGTLVYKIETTNQLGTPATVISEESPFPNL